MCGDDATYKQRRIWTDNSLLWEEQEDDVAFNDEESLKESGSDSEECCCRLKHCGTQIIFYSSFSVGLCVYTKLRCAFHS